MFVPHGLLDILDQAMQVEEMTEEQINKLVKFVIKSGHLSTTDDLRWRLFRWMMHRPDRAEMVDLL